MYAVYNYAAGTTTTNVIADIVKLITGETNKANLSANCVQANTNIVSTVAAGWTEHDAAAGTDYRVVKRLAADGTTMKYYGIKAESATVIRGLTYESWNETTHTATNAIATNWSTAAAGWSSAAGGYLYLYVTPRNIYINTYASGSWLNVSSMAFVELTRDTIPAGYPCAALGVGSGVGIGSDSSYCVIPRVKNATTSGDSVISGTNYYPMAASIVSTTGTSGQAYWRDASENVNVVLHKIGVSMRSGYTGFNFHHLGDVYDILAAGSDLGNPLDEIVYSGKTYVMFKVSGSPCILVPKE